MVGTLPVPTTDWTCRSLGGPGLRHVLCREWQGAHLEGAQLSCITSHANSHVRQGARMASPRQSIHYFRAPPRAGQTGCAHCNLPCNGGFQ